MSEPAQPISGNLLLGRPFIIGLHLRPPRLVDAPTRRSLTLRPRVGVVGHARGPRIADCGLLKAILCGLAVSGLSQGMPWRSPPMLLT